MAGDLTLLADSALMRLTMAREIFSGASKPCYVLVSNPGNPDSTTVGKSGVS